MDAKFRLAVATCVAAVALGGCENWSSIYREANLDRGTTLITDAKQRAIINVRDYRPSRDASHRIICAEPSPDVAQAVQVALQASAAVSRGDTRVDAGLAFSMAAQVAQLGERLAAIQLLRDKMYRACEASANGATTQGGYISMLSRIDKTMATMLATEMAAGAFGRNLATLQGNASTSQGANPAGLRVAQDDLEAANKALSASRKTFDDAGEDKDKKASAAKEIAAAADKVKDAAAKVLLLEVRSATNAGGSAGSSVGKIDGSRSSDPAIVASIHRNYIDDDGVEGLIDACVTELSRVRYAYDDFIDLARKNDFFPTTEQRKQLEADTGKKEGKISISNADYQRHYTAYIEIRRQFVTYCMSSVLGNGNGGISPFIAERQKAKQRLRQMAEQSTMLQQCAPVLRDGPKNDGQRVLFGFCKEALAAPSR